jgi:hypothetical protein
MVELFPQLERSKGKHVFTAFHKVMESIYPDRFGGGNERELPQTRFNLGNALEHAIIEAYARDYPDKYARPGQLEFDDIYGTPDLWDIEEWCTVEIKLTWASSTRADDIEDSWFWRYWSQLKSYCYMAGQTKGRLIIVFINGNYRYGEPEGQPTGMMWEWEWTPEELHENWQMIKAQLEDE